MDMNGVLPLLKGAPENGVPARVAKSTAKHWSWDLRKILRRTRKLRVDSIDGIIWLAKVDGSLDMASIRSHRKDIKDQHKGQRNVVDSAKMREWASLLYLLGGCSRAVDAEAIVEAMLKDARAAENPPERFLFLFIQAIQPAATEADCGRSVLRTFANTIRFDEAVFGRLVTEAALRIYYARAIAPPAGFALPLPPAFAPRQLAPAAAVMAARPAKKIKWTIAPRGVKLVLVPVVVGGPAPPPAKPPPVFFPAPTADGPLTSLMEFMSERDAALHVESLRCPGARKAPTDPDCCVACGRGEIPFSAKKNSKDEPMVCCDDCGLWAHHTCVLYNALLDFNDTGRFSCPGCLSRRRQPPPSPRPQSMLGAKDLPRTPTSDFMETSLAVTLATARAAAAAEAGVPLQNIPTAEGLVLRVVSSVEMTAEVDPGYQGLAGGPAGFPGISKCMMLFQAIDGVDVLLFVMYVQEYGQDCPAPNARRAFISYLDSVKHMQPQSPGLSTCVYHGLIKAYLAHLATRGFEAAHIWSCPPTAKDPDYVFNCHPPEQKLLGDAQLRRWYGLAVHQAVEEGIVSHATTFYDEFLAASATGEERRLSDLPYFTGDCLPYLAKKIIDAGGASKKRKAGGVTEQALMQGLGVHFCAEETKGNFIVAHLRTMAGIDVPMGDTTDHDGLISHLDVDDRTAFLVKLCQGNHYQFDTLRRAKHASMMVLYHLHIKSTGQNAIGVVAPPGAA